MSGKWSDSGKIMNPGKRLFINLAVRAVAKVNMHSECDNISISKKSNIEIGMDINLNGRW